MRTSFLGVQYEPFVCLFVSCKTMYENPLRVYISTQKFWFFVIVFTLIAFIGLFIPIMEIDAAQYASISREMLERNSFLEVTDGYKDYLDKPPLLFWMSAASIHLFGNTSLGFKLPSFLIALFSVFALFHLTKILYDTIAARIAALVYLSSVGFVLMVNDVRTDTLLISFVVIAVWQIMVYIEKGTSKNLLWGFVAIAFAMMAKGPIGFVVPALAIAPHVFLKGRIRRLLNWRWLLGPIIILLILSPMLYGLYTQFDLHPEKEAYGLVGPSGIKFFFWDQSFGRITGENSWKNDATFLYFVHNIAWAFIPFTIFLFGGLIHSLKNIASSKEYVGLFGFLLPFIALSMSHYKLPHYIYITIPFGAILVAAFLQSTWFTKKFVLKSITYFQYFLAFILVVLGLILSFYIFTASTLELITILLVLLYFAYYFIKSKEKLLTLSLSAFAFSAFVLNFHAYPSLLKFQSSSEIAFYINQNEIPKERVFQYNAWGRTLNYYTDRVTPNFDKNQLKEFEEVFVYTKAENLPYFEQNFETEIKAIFPNIKVTRLTIGFLNPNTRDKNYSTKILIKIRTLS